MKKKNKENNCFMWEDWRTEPNPFLAFVFYCIDCPLAIIMIATYFLMDKI